MKVFIFVLGFIILSPFSLLANQMSSGEKGIDSFYHNLSQFSTMNPQEKVYLHLDNTSYFMGESLWYKANVVDAGALTPNIKSVVLYVDLLSQEGFLVKRNRHFIKDGMCSGSFELPDTLNAGYYEIRAYTAWMLNFGRVFNDIVVKRWWKRGILNEPKNVEKQLCEVPTMYSRVFPIYNKVPAGQYNIKQMRTRPRVNWEKLKEENNDLIVKFYPEGGHLIENRSNRIAFELRDESGRSISPGSLFVKTASGEVLDTLRIVHDGRGIFMTDWRYWKAGWKNCRLSFVYQKKTYEYALPEAKNRGISLQLDVNEAQVDARIYTLNVVSPLYITLQHGGKPVNCQLFGMKDSIRLSFPIDSLKQGVHQLTVSDNIGRVLADRLFFVWKQESPCFSMWRDSVSGKREPYKQEQYSFCLKNKNGNGLSNTSFSVAIRDNDNKDLHFNSGNILTELLLSSEIRGFVQSPEYYFEVWDTHHRKALDMLMMIQGWRRYDWQLMAGIKEFKPFYPIERGMQVKGTVFKTNESNEEVKKLNKDVFVRCQICYPQNYVYDVVQETNNGEFCFDVVQIYGKYPMFIQVYEHKDKIKKQLDYSYKKEPIREYYVCKNRVFPPLPKQYDYYEIHEKDQLSISFFEQSIEQVTVREKSKMKLDFSQPDICYDFVEMCDYLNDFGVGNCISPLTIASYMTTFLIFPAGANIHLHTSVEGYEAEHKLSSRQEALYLIKDVFNYGKVKDACGFFDIRDRARFVNGMDNRMQTDYYVNYTRRKNKENLPDMVGDRCVFYGYTPEIEYYSPDYSTTLPETPDYRRTLYWNPDVRTDENGSASIQFYNNSTCKKMLISAEGVTKDGQPFYLKLEE